jgi:hypothetical protein
MKLGVLLITVLFTVAFSAERIKAQVHYRFFYGKVLSSESREPVSNVNISFLGSKMGTVSDDKGAFSFYIDTIPVFMIVSHVGYKTKKIFLDGKSNSMTLYMDKEVRELKEVEITANKIVPIFTSEHYTLRDYEIDSGMIYLLIYHTRVSKEELICMSLDEDTVARSGILSFTPISLFKDCLGNLQVIGRDSVYQVFRKDKDLAMIDPVSVEKFDEILLNCVASTKQVLFFKRMINLEQGVTYYGIDRVSKEKKMLTTMRDEYKLKQLRRNPGEAMQLATPMPSGRSVNTSMQFTNTTRLKEDEAMESGDWGTFDEWSWVHKILYRPMKTALYVIGDFICIFDIPDRELEFYDQNGNFSLKLKLNVDVIKEGKWSGDIFLDESQSKVYTTFQKSTGSGLYRIDLNTGDLHKVLAIKHPFPQKIKIYKEQIYYLYDIHGNPDDKTLYRQNL